jgi:hypothetical protein
MSKITNSSQTEKRDILSEEFQEDVRKIERAVNLRKWTLRRKSSDRMSNKLKGSQTEEMDILSEEF